MSFCYAFSDTKVGCVHIPATDDGAGQGKDL